MQKKHIVGYTGTALVALVIGIAAGGGSSDETSTSNAAAEVKTETVTVAAEPETKTKTVTKTVTEKAKAPAKKASSSSSKKSFSGNGGKTLPPIEVSEPSTLKWTNDGDIFQVFPKDLDSSLTINSQASSGETHVEPGTYTLDVNALGNWTIEITAAN